MPEESWILGVCNRPGFMEPGIGLDSQCLENARFLKPGIGLDFIEPGLGLDSQCLEKAGFLNPGICLGLWSLE
jgi:hypothetical protein